MQPSLSLNTEDRRVEQIRDEESRGSRVLSTRSHNSQKKAKLVLPKTKIKWVNDESGEPRIEQTSVPLFSQTVKIDQSQVRCTNTFDMFLED